MSQSWEIEKWHNKDWQPDDNYNADWSSTSKPVIIGGCPRSGSTILRLLLGNHPNLIDGPETHLFLPLPVDTNRLEKRFQLPENSLAKPYEASSSRGEFIDGFQKTLLKKSGCSYWV